MFRLDSPLNRIELDPNGTFPQIPDIITQRKFRVALNSLLLAANVGPATLAAYDELWRVKDSLDARAIALDRNPSMFTPIGSYKRPDVQASRRGHART